MSKDSYHLYGINKHSCDKKISGIYYSKPRRPTEPLLRGFDDYFPVPTSRYTTISSADVKANKDLVLLADSEISGMTLAKSKDNRSIFMTGHLEYDIDTLAKEYERDIAKGIEIEKPANYFTDDDPAKKIHSKWRSTAHLFYSNWLNYYVYQATPFLLNEIPETK